MRISDWSSDVCSSDLAHIARMEATSETAGARLESVTGEMSGAVDGLLDRTAGAVDEARKGIAAQGEAMLAMLETNQAALDRATRDSVDTLSGRIAEIEATIDRLAARLGDQQATSEALLGGPGDGIGHIEPRLAALPSDRQIGRASWRERVCQSVNIAVVDVYLKKKKNNRTSKK